MRTDIFFRIYPVVFSGMLLTAIPASRAEAAYGLPPRQTPRVLPVTAASAHTPAGIRALSFTENLGQVTDQYGTPRRDIDFVIHADNGLSVFIGSGTLHYQWHRAAKESDSLSDTYRMDVTLSGADPAAKPSVHQEQPFQTHYYLQHTGPGGVHARSFGRIVYADVYPGIDWVFRINGDGLLEHDFVIRPGGNPSDIRLQYKGATDIRPGNSGGIIASTPFGTVSENAPYSYLLENGKPGRTVPSSFLLEQHTLSFNTDTYPGGDTMIIDPVLDWATYYGGSRFDWRGYVTGDTSGNIYLSGDATSTSNIATTGSHQQTIAGNIDAFLAKFSPEGVRLWATYFGGNQHDYAWASATDSRANIYIAGQTYSQTGMGTPGSHQPAMAGGGSDAWLGKFDSSGRLLWSTYYGGSGSGGDGVDYGFAVTCDAQDNVYMAGSTTSSTGIASTGAHQTALSGSSDGFLVKFNSAGVRQWGTYYGGSAEDQARGISCDDNGNVFLTGFTLSTSGISSTGSYQTAHSGGFDAFLVKFGSAGTRLWGTYFGGAAMDESYAVYSNPAGNEVYITGKTLSSSGIATTGTHQQTPGGGGREDVFIARFDGSGNRVWGTYYGGTMDDEARAITAGEGNLYIAGFTSSTSQIATPDAVQPVKGNDQDAFIARFTPSGQRDWASYYGGNGLDYGYSVHTHLDRIYMAGQTASTGSIATPGSHQDTHGGGDPYDDYIVRFNNCDTPPATLSYDTDTVFCDGGRIELRANTGPGLRYQWMRDHTAIPGAVQSSYTAVSAGVYGVRVFSGSCGTPSSTVTVIVHPRPGRPDAGNNGPLCNGQTLELTASAGGAQTWEWSGPALFTTTARNPSIGQAQPRNAGIYKVTASNAYGCVSDTGYTAVSVVRYSVQVRDTVICPGVPAVLKGTVHAPDSFSGFTYRWTPADGIADATEKDAVATLQEGSYRIVFTAVSGAPAVCTASDTATITVLPPVILQDVTPGQTVKYDEPLQLYAGGADFYIWSPSDFLDNTTVQNPVAQPRESIVYTVTGTRHDGCNASATVPLEVDYTVNDFIPTAFTPNGDGKNDLFRVANLTTQQLLEFRVFNRWGQEVFATTDKGRGWDGTWHGVPQETGTYHYIIRMVYPDKTEKFYKGSVTLIR